MPKGKYDRTKGKKQKSAKNIGTVQHNGSQGPLLSDSNTGVDLNALLAGFQPPGPNDLSPVQKLNLLSQTVSLLIHTAEHVNTVFPQGPIQKQLAKELLCNINLFAAARRQVFGLAEGENDQEAAPTIPTLTSVPLPTTPVLPIPPAPPVAPV